MGGRKSDFICMYREKGRGGHETVYMDGKLYNEIELERFMQSIIDIVLI